MTWLRMDTDLRDHKVVGDLAAALKVPLAHALGLYAGCLFGFGEHFPEAYPARVNAELIEKWASWRGKTGKFAEAFRRLCVETEDGQKDPPGRIKGWWRQEALLNKQAKDRQRPASSARPPKNSPDIPPEIPRGNLGGNVDVDEYVNEISTTTAPDVSPLEYKQRCTVAGNRGMRDNPHIQGFNELVTSNQDIPAEWQQAGIPIEIAEHAIYWRSATYRPSGSRRQPTSLRYFDRAVAEAWDRHQSRASEGSLSPGEQPPVKGDGEDDIMAAARRLERQRETVGGTA